MDDTFIPPVPPSYNSQGKKEYKTLVASFGDGYTVRAGDGLNAIRRTWSLTWENIKAEDADTLEAFFDSMAGYKSFVWTPPRGAQGKWIAKDPERDPIGPNTDTISVTFEEVFDL